MHIVQIGCGVVGFAYVKAYQEAGNKVTCIEANYDIINKNSAEYEFYHISDDLSHIVNVDFIMISINTPLKGEKLDLTYLFSSIQNVATLLRNSPDAYVVVRSTVPPMTTKEYKAKLEEEFGANTHVLFQPEFLRAKSAFEDALNPWCVVIGLDEGTPEDKLISLYSQFVSRENIYLVNVEEAEFLKLIHNSFNAAKISYFNQCLLLLQKINNKKGTNMDINNITHILPKTCEGLMNSYYGTKAGHGYYGVCLPKDSAEIASLEREYDLQAPLFQAVVGVNKQFEETDVVKPLDGDFQLDHKTMKRISSGNLAGQI